MESYEAMSSSPHFFAYIHIDVSHKNKKNHEKFWNIKLLYLSN